VSKPRYSGTWKEQILKAIAIDGALWWNEIREVTGLDEYPLNKALAELFQDGVIEKQPDRSYWVDYDLYNEYRSYYGSKSPKKPEPTITIDIPEPENIEPLTQDKLIKRVQEWVNFKKSSNPNLKLSSNHIHLKGDLLSSISEEIIEHGEKEILLVNPYVEKCHITEKLIHACRRKIEVKLIANSPERDFYESLRKKSKIEYHKIPLDGGLKLYYNNTAHAKLLIVDGKIAVVSSMNLYGGSTAGNLWETGIVSIDPNNVRQIQDSFRELEAEPATKPVTDQMLSKLMEDISQKMSAFKMKSS
jgi:phosphatidylserine/phosphatidylglycerophosphate/cardiolipin synthase-like enzyme